MAIARLRGDVGGGEGRALGPLPIEREQAIDPGGRRLGRDDVVDAPVERAAGAEPTDGPVRTLPLLLDAVEDPAGRLLLLRRREALERAEHPRHLLESLGPRSLRPLGTAALRRPEPGPHPEAELAVH